MDAEKKALEFACKYAPELADDVAERSIRFRARLAEVLQAAYDEGAEQGAYEERMGEDL